MKRAAMQKTFLNRGPHFIAFAAASLSIVLLASGCAHRHQPTISAAASAPKLATPPVEPPAVPTNESSSAATVPIPGNIPPSDSPSDAEFVAAHVPIYSETGRASWYGPPYNHHKGANGQVYDQEAMTAAHRTLPMNSLLRVTNVQTGQSAIMRVTDRGPFVPDRVLDLSLASARAVGVYRPGTAQVRIDVYETPAPIDEGGRWCVQIGAIQSEREAKRIEEHLQKKYSTANVIEFTGPTGHWVRIRPAHDDKQRAIEIAAKDKPSEGNTYLVRLD
jgi:rare lipoprotein A